MTFKHVKFEDSAVMRSLEKLAKEQGLVTPTPLTKKASAEAVDLSPTDNLMENVLNLCTGLRQSGLNKQAQELEQKFFVYKQAQTLYEAFTEKGEDLVDRAHPKGSHKLEDVDSDEAVVETILDQHLKTVQMIDKKPTGKLASSKNILGAVKTVLGQDAEEEMMMPLRADKAIMALNSVVSILNKAKSTILNKMNTTTLAKSFDTNLEEIQSEIQAVTRETPPNVIIKTINAVNGDLGDIQNSIDFFNWKDIAVLLPFIGPAIGMTYHGGDIADLLKGNWEGELRAKISAFITQSRAATNKARSYVIGEHDAELKKSAPSPEGGPAAAKGPFASSMAQVKGLKDKLNTWLSYRVISKNPTAANWIKEELDSLTDIETRYGKVPEGQQEGAAAQLQKEIGEETKDINDFESKWIRG